MSSINYKDKIKDLVHDYYQDFHLSKKKIIPGKDYIPVTIKTFDEKEIINLVDSSLEFWLTSGRYNEQFQEKLSKFTNIKFCSTVNSGSSANLIALSCLTSEKIGKRKLEKGDEVITVASGFPTTINPILQNNLVPVFLDVKLGHYNLDCSQLEKSLSKKTKAVMIAHTLGNPFDIQKVHHFCKENNLFLIEDCADALGAKYDGKKVGTFGNIATTSFYPAHHITTGEGGAVMTNSNLLKFIIESFRDWGRDCYCDPGVENTCCKRFDWQLGDLPHGYDHKYIYSHAGYNLKMTDMQAAIGVSQLDKIDNFIDKRKINFNRLKSAFSDLNDYLILPEYEEKAEPSWFGFPLTVRDDSPEIRKNLMKHYEQNKIGTRLLFGGNIIKQPYMKNRSYRIVGDLKNSDKIMNSTYWIGLHPQINEEHIEYMFDITKKFFKN